MMNKILMIGPHTKAKGGIASVFSMYETVPEIDSLYTYIDANKFKKLLFYFISIFKFFYLIITNKYSHIHIHSASRGSFYRKSIFVIFGKLLNKKIIFHLHGGEFDKFYKLESGKIKRYFIKSIIKKCDFVFVVSSPWKKILSELFPDIKIKILHNPISEIYLNTNIENITLNKSIVFVGRLDKAKGLDAIIKVYSKISEKYPTIDLVFIGEGDRKYLYDIATKYNVQNKISLTGWLDTDDKVKVMKDSFLMLFPSHFETFGMSILESIAIGLPVVTTNVGGIPDIIIDGYNGFLTDVDDLRLMEKQIILLYENKNKLNEISRNGKIKANEFIFSKILKKYKKLLEK